MKQRKKVKYLAIWFLLTILAFTSAIVWERSTRNVVSATSRPTIAKKKTPSVHGKKIQDIQLGERVLGKNPQANDGLDESILTEVPHVGYNLLMKKPDGTNSCIELLRPKNWLETEKVVFREISDKTNVEDPYKNAIRQKSSDGKECNIEVYIDLPEMGTTGWATLISIKDKIEIKAGPGNVVTGRFRHIANNVIDLQIEGVDKIGCTDNHPFWSEDRQDFIEAGKLIEGERVLLYSGEPRRVVQKLPRPGPQYVNNLEVFGEHVYHVTLDGVLVHNQYNGKVYRGLRVDEDPTLGLYARDINANATPASHVNGKKLSQWISTTKDVNIAITKYGKYRVVEIDLSKLPPENILDLSQTGPVTKSPRIIRYAIHDQEILIKEYIPPEAITIIK